MVTISRFSALQIGLVIDLTNTNRYYKEKEFTSQNVKYIKVGLSLLSPSSVGNLNSLVLLQHVSLYPDQDSVLTFSEYMECRLCSYKGDN